MISELVLCSPPAKPSRSRQAMASITQRVIRKKPAASPEASQSPSGPPWKRGPA